MGVAAARVLAEREHDVILLDRFGVANDLGSSAHASRIFRLAYADPVYVRMARRALLLWRELESRDETVLIVPTGLVEIGGPHDAIVSAVRGEGATILEADGADVGRWFPEVRPRPGVPIRFQPAAGSLFARNALTLQADHAARHGAEVSGGERALSIEPVGDRVRVRTDLRLLDADKVVVTAGPWVNELLDPIGMRVNVFIGLGQTTYFGGGRWEQRPCIVDWGTEDAGASSGLYGLPTIGHGYKLGLDGSQAFELEDHQRRVDRIEQAQLVERVATDFPGLDPKPLASQRCPWTSTPDGDFILDRRGPVVVGSGCSGHAFKFSPLLGEMLADICEERPSAIERHRFALDRDSLVSGRVVSGGITR